MIFGKDKIIVPASELLQKISDDGITSGTKNISIVAYFSDHADFVAGITENDIPALLELRIFDYTSEFRAYRSMINEDFICRFYEDEDFDEDEKLYETQYLDIDSTHKSIKNSIGMYEYKTMNGGTYHLPIENAEKLRICNYLMYNDENIAQVYDYRFVEIIAKGDSKNG